MKGKIVTIFFTIILCLSTTCTIAVAQVGLFVPKDERIKKYQNELLQYLVKQKQFRGTNDSITLENYKDRMIVRRGFEIHSDFSSDMLLIRFQANLDHCDKFWGVLTKKSCYLFFSFKDPQFILLERQLDPRLAKFIRYYCKTNDDYIH